MLVNNESLYEISSRNIEIDEPSFCNINHQISQIVSSMTAGLRFEGLQSLDMLKLQTNLVPYPRIHFVMASYAPLLPSYRTYLE